MVKQDLPQFLIIGSMKCGTSSLHYYLNEHPEIEMSSDKDLCFFSNDERYDQGIEWYKTLFKKTSKLKGETSATYVDFSNSPNTPNRIKTVLGDQVKLILLARDPVDRFVSHYKHDFSAGRINEGINNFILNKKYNSAYINLGLYHQQLQHFLEVFHENQILVISSEKLLSDRKNTLQTIFKFLGVQSSFESSNFENMKHLSSDKRKLNRLGNFLKDKRFVWRFVHYFSFTGSKIKTEELQNDALMQLKDIFREDVEQFKILMNSDFSEWRTYHSAE